MTFADKRASRTPPNTRSVTLLGSWDNFTKPYAMEKDNRMGRGHWKGCHTFTNIICDGETNSPPPGRSGGLKMGGTYWYYYQLDNEVDYFNEAEPVTTACPFLPGQPLNVLNVPIHLPSSQNLHVRDSSPAPQTSNQETMNPDDKYMNPRAPPRPVLPRLATSPAMLMRQDYPMTSPLSSCSSLSPVNERSSSHPRTIVTRRRFRVPGKLSLDLKSAINSSPLPNSLRSAFKNFASPRSVVNDENNRGRRQEKEGENNSLQVPGSGSNSRGGSNTSSPLWYSFDNSRNELRYPSELYVADSNSSSLYPSREQSSQRTAGSSPLKTRWKIEESLPHGIDGGKTGPLPYITLEALQESLSQQHTSKVVLPSMPNPRTEAPGPTTPLDLHGKRLPTLPNSPSSVLDAELFAMDQENPCGTSEEEYFQSHFSDFTAESPDDSYSPESFLQPGCSRFSECSTDTDNVSPCSMTSASTFNNSTTFSPISNEDSEALETALAKQARPTPSLFGSISDDRSSESNIYIEDDNGNRSANTTDYSTDIDISALYISKTPHQKQDYHQQQQQQQQHLDSTIETTTNQSPKRSNNNNNNNKYTSSPAWTNLILKHNNYAPDTNSLVMDDNSDLPTPRAKPPSSHHHCCRPGTGGTDSSSNVQSTMQELMDELSYLGDMIEENAATAF
ncbi:hypothetical protein FQN50_000135 [Emmonsiellopsis sp. PD_5]|nr:hypothetical protein FQN50_000135 [Emmonsiellopsis sp. PD_5]